MLHLLYFCSNYIGIGLKYYGLTGIKTNQISMEINTTLATIKPRDLLLFFYGCINALQGILGMYVAMYITITIAI